MAQQTQNADDEIATRLADVDHPLLVFAGDGGTTVYKEGRETEYGSTKGKLQTYWDADRAARVAREMGLPVVNTSVIRESERRSLAWDSPLLAQLAKDIDPADSDLTSMRRVPPRSFFDFWAENGAECYNREGLPDWEVPDE